MADSLALGALPWLNFDGSLRSTWTLVAQDTFALAKNPWGFLLGYLYPVPLDPKTGQPIMTLAAMQAISPGYHYP